MRRLVAVHQPNFFPWLGFFDKTARADVFVLLDDVQFPRTGAGNPVNRVKVLISERPSWLTVPVMRAGAGLQSIRDVKIDETQSWRRRILRTLEHNYRRESGFEDGFPLVRDLFETPTDRLADFNETCIRRLVTDLRLCPRIVRSSDLNASGSGTERLVQLVKAVGGSAYLSGDGTADYQDDSRFHASGLELVFQRFRHPRTPHAHPEFGLSILDPLLRLGKGGTRALLEQPRSLTSQDPVALSA